MTFAATPLSFSQVQDRGDEADQEREVSTSLRQPPDGMRGEDPLLRIELAALALAASALEPAQRVHVTEICDAIGILRQYRPEQETDFGLERVLKSVVALFVPHARAKGLRLRLDYDPQAAEWFRGNEHALRTQLSRLLAEGIAQAQHEGMLVRLIAITPVSAEMQELRLVLEPCGSRPSAPSSRPLSYDFSLRVLPQKQEKPLEGRKIGLLAADYLGRLLLGRQLQRLGATAVSFRNGRECRDSMKDLTSSPLDAVVIDASGDEDQAFAITVEEDLQQIGCQQLWIMPPTENLDAPSALPIAADELAAALQALFPAPAPSDLRLMRICVIDPHPTSRLVFEKLLKGVNVDAWICDSLTSAQRACAETLPDVVICSADLDLSKLDIDKVIPRIVLYDAKGDLVMKPSPLKASAALTKPLQRVDLLGLLVQFHPEQTRPLIG